MVIRTYPTFFIIILLTLTANAILAEENEPVAEKLERWNLHENKTKYSDYLAYTLKYRGLYSLFFWKDLADVAVFSNSLSDDFDGNKSCQIAMKLTTENYSFVESVYPYRYQWRSKVSPDLTKVFLVEEIAKGTNGEYNVRLLNWKDKFIDFFRQRQLIVPQEDVFEEVDVEEEFFGDKKEKPKPYWEKDGKKPVPAYFNHLPRLEEKYDYLVYDKSIEFEQNTGILDPLAVMYSARWYNNKKFSDQVYNITYKDEIREYRLEVLGEETVTIGTQEISAMKLNIMLTNKKEAKDEGFMVIWVSNDAKRLPLKYEIKVRLGRIHITLTEESMQEYSKPQSCLAVAHGSKRDNSSQSLNTSKKQ